MRELPCEHAMVVIEKEKLWVFDYVNPGYKAATQRTIYLNVVHPMETHDNGTVDDNMGAVVGVEELDDDFNRRILLPKNQRQPGRPQI